MAKYQSEYWIPQAKKFCDFCKCWISDNKPSVQFHENGKRHKENVAKRLTEISKKSAKDAKKAVEINKDMKKMEDAAMKAYMKDIEASADYTSQEIRKKIGKEPIESILFPNKDKETEEERKQETGTKQQKGKNSVAAKNKEIYRVRQNKGVLKEETIGYGPAPRGDPYGAWQVVKEEKYKPLELDLPECESVGVRVPIVVKETQDRTFKEKKLPVVGASSSTTSGSNCGFKKRKLGTDLKRNMRQRLDDD